MTEPAHRTDLAAPPQPGEPAKLQETVADLYGLLSIIDAKASSLLTFNAIGLTAISVWLGYVPPNWLHLALDAIFIILLGSCILCLLAVFLYWIPDSKLGDPIHIGNLKKKKVMRTRVYWSAWGLSMVSVALLISVSTLHFLDTYGQVMSQDSESLFNSEQWRNLDYPQR